MRAAIDALAQHIPVSRACEVLGFPRSRLYRQRQSKVKGTPAPRPTPARALSSEERRQVRDLLNSERFADQSPYELYATLLDEGVYHCSIRTMYRLLADYDEVQARRNQLRHPAYTKPELLTTKPTVVLGYYQTERAGYLAILLFIRHSGCL
jgi:putative transposase